MARIARVHRYKCFFLYLDMALAVAEFNSFSAGELLKLAFPLFMLQCVAMMRRERGRRRRRRRRRVRVKQ